jgi:hypothetical protein
MVFDRFGSQGVRRKLWLLPAAAMLIALMTGSVRADSAAPVAVSDVTDASSPIGIYQSGFFLSSNAAHVLWIAYANRSSDLIARFELRASWVDDAGTERASFSTIVSTVIGPGERTTAAITGLAPGPPGTVLHIAVDRVRFNNLALWIPTRAATAAVTAQRQSHMAPAGDVARSPDRVTLSAGTSFDIEIAAFADSETAHDGEVVPFVAERDVLVDGVTVIARDAIGWGHLESVGRAANWGRSGSLQFVADSITAIDGSRVHVDGGLRLAPPRVRPAGLGIFGGMFLRGRAAELLLGSPASVTCVQDVSVAVLPLARTAVAR